MNLEQLYHERFQSFEMTPSSNISQRMQSKIKFAKTLQLLKWIVIGTFIAAAAVSLTIFSLSTEKPQEQRDNYNHQPIIEQTLEISELEIQKITIAQILETESESNNTELNIEDEKPLQTTTALSYTMVEEINIATKIQADDEKQRTITANNDSNIFDQVSNLTSETQQNTESPLGIDTKLDTELEKNNTRITKPIEAIESIEQKVFPLLHTSKMKHPEQRNLKLSTEIKEDTINKKTKVGGKTLSDIKKPRNRIANWKAYFDLHSSPVIWNNNANFIAPNLDTSWTYILDHKAQLSYEFGLSFQLHHSKLPLFMQLGLNYQVLKEKIDFQVNHTFEDTELSYWTYDSTFNIHNIIDTIFVIVDSNYFVIDTLFTQDTVLSKVDSLYNSIMSTEENKKSFVNTYTYLNIPLLLGYQFETKNKKWNFQVLAGAAVAINLQNKGYYYNDSGGFESYSGKVTASLAWSFYAAASANYHLKKWQIFLQPEYQHQLNESRIPDLLNQRKYRFFKLKFGIRYQLF